MDKFAQQTFIENYSEPKYYPENVYNREIPKESVDIYMTSPPCQAFSIAGKRKGESEERGVLFYNSHEFILKNKPRYFIFENVKGLLSDDNGKTFQRWIDYLSKSVNGQPVIFPHEESANYHVYHKVLNSKHYGVPQNRERIFIIGIRDDADNNFTFPPKEHLTKRLKNILEDDVDEKYFLSDSAIKSIILNDNNLQKSKVNPEVASALQTPGNACGVYKGMTAIDVKQLNESKECGGKQPYQQNRVYDINELNPALNAGQEAWGGNILNTPAIRRLTPRECFRLQDFPDSFKMPCSDSQMYKQAGNSITVGVLEKIINRLIKI